MKNASSPHIEKGNKAEVEVFIDRLAEILAKQSLYGIVAKEELSED